MTKMPGKEALQDADTMHYEDRHSWDEEQGKYTADREDSTACEHTLCVLARIVRSLQHRLELAEKVVEAARQAVRCCYSKDEMFEDVCESCDPTIDALKAYDAAKEGDHG